MNGRMIIVFICILVVYFKELSILCLFFINFFINMDDMLNKWNKG